MSRPSNRSTESLESGAGSESAVADRPAASKVAKASALPRLELALLGAFSGAWLLAVLLGLGILPAAGVLPLDLYSFYSFGAALGWVAGNVYVARRRRLDPRLRRRLLLTYLVGPPSLLYVLRSLAPYAVQNAAPFVPLYGFCVFGLFFLVPVTLRYKPGVNPPG